MYRKVDFEEETSDLKKYKVCAWSGEKLKYVTVTVENNKCEKINRKYYFANTKEYTRFLRILRGLYE